MEAKVFKVDVRLGIQLSRGRDEGTNQLVILVPPHSPLPETQVQGVVQERLVVGATVQNHRQHPARVYPAADGRENELGDGDQDAAAPLVADTEDLFAVCFVSAAGLEGRREHVLPVTTM